jgi:hypothetical protein
MGRGQNLNDVPLLRPRLDRYPLFRDVRSRSKDR